MAKKRSSAANNEHGGPEVSFKNEVILWGVLALSVILFISNFGIAGKLGNAVSDIFFGLFGFLAYIFPILLFAGTAFVIANRDNAVILAKAAAFAVFLVFLCMFLELIGGNRLNQSPLDSYLWSVDHRYGGGLVGGLLTWLIRSNLGTISAYIIDIAAMIICLVLVTERSLWKPIKSGSKKVYVSAKNETIRHREVMEERRQRRLDNKVSGVSTDTVIKNPAKQDPGQRVTDDVSEIRPLPAAETDFPIHVMGYPQENRQPENPIPKNQMSDEVVQTEEDPVPIANQKIVLHPNVAQQKQVEKQAEADEADTDWDLDILANTSEIFSDLLPAAENASMNQTNQTLHTFHAEEAADRPAIQNIQSKQAAYEADRTETGQENGQAGQKETTRADEPTSRQPDRDTGIHRAGLAGGAQTDAAAYETNRQDPAETRQSMENLPDADRPAVSAKVPAAARPRQSQAEIASGIADVDVQMRVQQPKQPYVLPPVHLLKAKDPKKAGDSRQHLQETALKLQQTLKNFGVNVTILNVSCGPSVTRYEIQPEMGVKVSKIVNLADDIKLNLAAADIRIEAPIPGKAAIGIEVPNKENVPVMFRELIESQQFQNHASPCAFAAGKDIAGQVIVTDICKMPHLLIAGATGSGKSVCINTIIMSIIYKADPNDVKLIMVDPKVVELSVYNGIPHLLLPVVTDPKKAAGALHWAVSEMMDRYQKFQDYGVRDIKGYNAKIQKIAHLPDDTKPQKMPFIVIIVDELADLMMAAPGDVEDAICRLAQLARAAGMHLIIATQRPSVNVITGLIKANMPSRIAFSVTSGIDSRTILDMNGAEKLLGKGDMLFYPQGYLKPVRVQGAFVSDSEVTQVVDFLKQQNGTAEYSREIEEQVVNAASAAGGAQTDRAPGNDRDVYFADAAKLIIDKDKASVSMMQRYFKIGFNRAARIMDQLEEAGVVGPEEGTKPRKILMSPQDFAQYEEEVL